MVAAMKKWRRRPENLTQFRKSFGGLFKDDTGSFVRVDLDYIRLLELEFARFKVQTFFSLSLLDLELRLHGKRMKVLGKEDSNFVARFSLLWIFSS